MMTNLLIKICLQSSSLSRNPFIYDSKTENYKDPSASVGVKSVSRDSGSTALEYYDEAGNKLSIKDTLAPVSGPFPYNVYLATLSYVS